MYYAFEVRHDDDKQASVSLLLVEAETREGAFEAIESQLAIRAGMDCECDEMSMTISWDRRGETVTEVYLLIGEHETEKEARQKHENDRTGVLRAVRA